MRLALLSDIHANIQALDACLEHARAQGAQQYAVLGDLVGYGANPVEVVERIMQLAQQGATVIKGNHDAMAVSPPAQAKTSGERTAAWTHQQLSPDHLHWLAALAMTAHQGSVLMVHASADEPELWRYVYDRNAASDSLDAAQEWPGVRYVFGGHVHMQTLYSRSADDKLTLVTPKPGVAVPVPRHRQWLGTIGSVGQPRDGNPLSMYALLDLERAVLTFHRVRYDHGAAAAAIRRAGLPSFFADRLEVGR